MREYLSWLVAGVLCLSAAAALAQDTTYVYGGPGSLEGKFETAAGEPDRQGWIGVDLTLPAGSRWHIDTYNCANLDIGQPDNHAWWCGDDIPSCGGDDPEGGYGNGYVEYLDYYAEISDDQVSTTITVTAVLNYDNEPGYDYLYLEYEDATDMQIAASFNGQADSVVVNQPLIFNPSDYVLHPDTGNPSCHIRWYGRSDAAFSDQDCDFPSAGLAQIDNIEISGDNGVQTILEDCEGATLWIPGHRPGVGDFSKVWPMLDDADPDHQNDTPQFAFIDDGVVVPGTGGTLCTVWCYGPGGFCVNGTGGLAGDYYRLRNEIWSPPIAWPGESCDVAELTVDVYTHIVNWERPLVLVKWRIRTTPDPTGLSNWTEWSHAPTVVSQRNPEYVHRKREISELITAKCSLVQIAIGAHDDGICYVPPCENSTPAPYIDNVSVYVVSGLSDLPERGGELWLSDPSPNPFNPSTTVEFSVPQDGRVTVAVYNLRGQLIRILLDEQKQTGAHSVQWDGCCENGEKAATGTYLFRLEAGGKTVTKKGILVK